MSQLLTCPRCGNTWPTRPSHTNPNRVPVECPDCKYRPNPDRGRAAWITAEEARE